MTSVTSRNSSAFYRYFQFCCNDLQKRTAITFSHPKVLQELTERGEWLKRLITVGEGGGEAGPGEGEWGRSLPGLDLEKAVNPRLENLRKVGLLLCVCVCVMPLGRSDTLV